MPYCPRCGVEADPSVRNCPLCTTSIPRLDDLGPGEPAWPSAVTPQADPSQIYATPAELRSRAFLVIVGVFITAASAVIATDLFLSGSISWARWPLASLVAVLAMTASVFAWHQPGRWGTAWVVVTAGFLAVLDLCDDGRWGWFPSLGLPITALSFGLILVGVVTIRRSRLGYNLFALVPALAALELVGIDALVTAWTGVPGLGWSVVTSLVLGPLALLFAFLHFALHRTPDLKRIFHF